MTTLLLLLSGLAVHQVLGLVAQAAPSGVDLAPFANAGGAAAAVGGLVYVARAMISGRLVARDPAAVEQQLAELVRSQQHTNELLGQLVQEGHARERDLIDVLRTR